MPTKHGNKDIRRNKSEAKKRSGGTKKENKALKQEKGRQKVELDTKKTKSMKEDLQKLGLQQEKDFENLMSKAAEEKLRLLPSKE